MKKLLVIFVCFVLFLTFVGCQAEEVVIDNSASAEETDDKLSSYYNTYESFIATFTKADTKEDNYTIYTSDEYAGYFYTIYDDNGNFLDSGYHGHKGSFKISKEDNLVIFENGQGGSPVFPIYRLYDVKNGKVSRFYDGPIALDGDLIAYFAISDDSAKLIVQDAFDSEKTYQEFVGKFDINIFTKIQEISFSADGEKVIIKHCETNNEENIIEESFVLK